MKFSKIKTLIFLLTLATISESVALETAVESPCNLPAPGYFKAKYTAPNYVYLEWKDVPSASHYVIRTYQLTTNQLISTVNVYTTFKLLFIPSNKEHYSVISCVCGNGIESGFSTNSNIFIAHALDLLSIGYSPAPGNIECTISHGNQGCVISTTDINDFALRDELTENVLKTFSVQQETQTKHYQVLAGSANVANAKFFIKLDNQNPDYYNGIEYTIVADKNGEILATFQVYTYYNPNYAELFVTSLAEGFELVKYEDNNIQGNNPLEQRDLASPATAAFMLSPNPSATTCNIQLDVPASTNTNLQLMNLQGLIFQQNNIPEGASQYPIDITSLPAGVYLVRLESNGNIQTRKLLKSN